MRPFEFLPALYLANGDNRILDVNEQFKKQYNNSTNVIGRSLDDIKQPVIVDNFVSSPFKTGEREFAYFQFNSTKTDLVEFIYDVTKFEKESVSIAFIKEIFSSTKFNRHNKADPPFELGFENFDEIAFILNNDKNIEQVNDTASDKLGYSPKELLGVHISKISYKGIRSYLQRKWNSLLRIGESSGESLLETKQNELLFVEFRAVANIRLGLHLVLYRDIVEITSTKIAQQKN